MEFAVLVGSNEIVDQCNQAQETGLVVIVGGNVAPNELNSATQRAAIERSGFVSGVKIVDGEI